MTQSDAQLVQDVLTGSEAAYALLVGRYERPVRAVALRLLHHPDAAADVAQEAFVRAWQQLPKLRNPKAFGPWLMKITRHCALDSLRKQRFLQTIEGLELMAPQPNGQLDEKKQQLLEIIHKLPVSERQVILLRYFGPHPVRDVAAILGRTVGTVTKQLSRAHQRLKKRLTESQP